MNFVDSFISGNLIKPFNISAIFLPSDYNLQEITIGLRPEDIIVGQSGQFHGKVKSVEYLGDRSILTLKYLTHDITVVVDSNRYKGDQIEPNQPLAFGIDKDKVYLFHKQTGQRLN
jgi:ABC-type sugar transport system ATPase subunit